MAGFEKDDQYWLPRCRVQPSDELLSMVWPWLDYTLEFVMSDEEEHPTAVETLKYWAFLRVILLQDVAAMICMLPDDDPLRKHGLLEHPVFQSAPFQLFVEQMRAKLQTEAQPENDPNLKSVERALPGVNKQFSRTRSLVNECHVAAEEAAFHAVEAADGVGELKERVQQLEESVSNLPGITKQQAKKTRDIVRLFASCLKRSFSDAFEYDSGDDDGVVAADASPSSPLRRRLLSPNTNALASRPSPPPLPPALAPLEPEEKEGMSTMFLFLCGLFCHC